MSSAASDSEASPAPPPSPVLVPSGPRASFYCDCCKKTQSKIAKPNDCSTEGGDPACQVKVCTTCKRHCYNNPAVFTCFACKSEDSAPPCKKQTYANAPKRKKSLKSVNDAKAPPTMPRNFVSISESMLNTDSQHTKSLFFFHALSALALWGASELSGAPAPAPACTPVNDD